MRNGSMLVVLAGLAAGCGAGSAKFSGFASQNFVSDISTARKLVSQTVTAAPTEQSACEVRMFLEQLHGRNPQGIGNGELGVVVAERLAVGKLVNGVCIKRSGAKLLLPAAVLVATTVDGPSLDRFCRDDTQPYQLESPSGAAVNVRACTWNGVFHHTRPFTITLMTQPGQSVADYVEFLRVYRNGDLMAAWNRVSDQVTPDRVRIVGSSLISGILSVSHPPHMSAMDIRVIPRDDSITRVVDSEVRDDQERFELAIKTASEAALDAALPKGTKERASLDCLRRHLRADAKRIMRVVNGQIESLDPACSVLTGVDEQSGAAPAAPKPLSDAYAELKNQSREQLNALRTQAYSDVDKLNSAFLEQLPQSHRDLIVAQLTAAFNKGHGQESLSAEQRSALDACTDEFVKHTSATCAASLTKLDPQLAHTYEKLVQTAKVIDRDVTVVLGTADEALALADRLGAKAKDIAANPTQQAQIFNAFAQSLATHGDPFEPRRDNPPLLAGEQKIDLEYSDAVQGFVLAPWNGVPLRVNNGLAADFHAAVAVPLLDIAGLRYQWGKSRFADARIAAGIGYIETEVLATKANQAAALPNVSIGFGTLKVGFGIATGQGLGNYKDRMRIIVGADLFKLLSGSNAEVL